MLAGADFERVYGARRRVQDACFSINYAPSPAGQARLGLSIGGKVVGNAVARNRVKRVIRDWFRLQDGLPPLDLVVGARNAAAAAHNAQLRDSLDFLRTRLP